VHEGYPTPSRSTLTDVVNLDYYEVSVIIPFTRELFVFGRTSEVFLTNAILAAVSRFVDAQLLTSTITASAARPASLTNGAPSVSSTGSSAAQMVTDLNGLIAAIESPGDSLTWVMRPVTYARIVATLGGAGYTTAPGLLFGLPVITGSTSPQQITLVDTGSILFASDGAVRLSFSDLASIEMLDNNLVQRADTGVGANTVSLWQVSAIGVRASLGLNWMHLVESTSSPSTPVGCSYMTVSY
jgi:hypothetical protein